MIEAKKPKKILSARDILLSSDWLVAREKSAKHISTEHQDFGLRMAFKLNDPTHKSLYIKLAKEADRNMLETALSFAMDYPNVKSRGKIFMWKLKELKNAAKGETASVRKYKTKKT